MKTSVLCLLLALGLLGNARAVLVDFNAKYPEVQLRNGRVLKEVTFRTYDTATGKVGAVMPREALTLRINDLPNEVATRIRQQVPVLTEEEVKAEKAKAAQSASDARRRAREQEKRLQAAQVKDRDAQRGLDVRRAEAAIDKESQAKSSVTAAAKQLATHYFTYEADKHSNVGYVFDSNVLLDDPEPVSGWANRWRVRGKVGVQYLTRDIGGLERRAKEFELLIEAPPQGSPKLLDVTISRM